MATGIIKLVRRIIEIRARKSAQAKVKEVEVEQAVPATDDGIIEEDIDSPPQLANQAPITQPLPKIHHKNTIKSLNSYSNQ